MTTGSSTAKLVSLFLVTMLAATSGCSNQAARDHIHVDENRDGYCDIDGQSMPGRTSGPGHSAYRSPIGEHTGGNTIASSPSSGISSGAKGGLGSAHGGGGG